MTIGGMILVSVCGLVILVIGFPYIISDKWRGDR